MADGLSFGRKRGCGGGLGLCRGGTSPYPYAFISPFYDAPGPATTTRSAARRTWIHSPGHSLAESPTASTRSVGTGTRASVPLNSSPSAEALTYAIPDRKSVV